MDAKEIDEALDEIIECRRVLHRRRSQLPVIEEALKNQDKRGVASMMDLFALGLWAVIRFTR